MTALFSDLRVKLAACVAALAVAAAAGLLTEPKEPTTRPSDVAAPARTVVNRTALACPVLPADGKLAGLVNAVTPALPKGTPTAAGATKPLAITPLEPGANPLGTLLVRGTMASTSATTKPVPLSIHGTGPLAAGATATSTSLSRQGVNRGMASVPCQAPGSDFWFVGASGAGDRRDVLVLTNLDSINAEVNVTVYARNGKQDLPATRGIVVPARSTSELYLGLAAKGLRDLALHVESTGGRVAPALRDNATFKGTPAGVDWISPAAPPATKVFVPALAPGGGARILYVANPSELQATVSLTVHGPNGPFKPAGLESLQVPAGSVVAMQLHQVLNGDASAVTVSSDQPVTASARIIDGRNADFATLGAAEPLTGPAYLVIPPHRQPAVLQITAPGKAASIRFELRDAAGRGLGARSLDVVGGATVQIPFNAQRRATYLMVEQTRNTVVAGVTLTPGAKIKRSETREVAAWPLTTSLVFRAQLGALPDPAAALR